MTVLPHIYMENRLVIACCDKYHSDCMSRPLYV